MAKYRFGDIVKEVKEKVDRNHNPYEFFIAGDHMDTDELHLLRRGRFADSDVGPAFIRVFKPGQVLYGSRRTYLRKIAVADFEGITANTTFVLESKDENILLQKLLPFIMQSERFTDFSIKKSKGSTNPYVLFSDLCEYEVELPDIEQQKRLSEILWAIDATKTAYKNLISATDELVKSQFIEMFGDPEKDDCIGRTITVAEAIKDGIIDRPLDGNHGEKHPKNSDYVSEGVPFIMANNLVNGEVDLEHCAFIKEEQAATLKKGIAKTDDVLLSHKGTIGRVARIQASKYEFMMLTPQVTYYRCKRDLDPEYLTAYFQTDYFQNSLHRLITGSTRASVTITQQTRLPLVIPPLNMQQQFAAFVQQSDKSKFELSQTLDDLNRIYKKIISDNLG